MNARRANQVRPPQRLADSLLGDRWLDYSPPGDDSDLSDLTGIQDSRCRSDLFWTAADLELKLREFQRYFNGHRTHAGWAG